MKSVTFRPAKQIIDFLRNVKAGERSDVINAAIQCYINETPFSEELLLKIGELQISLDEIKRQLSEDTK